MATMEDVAKLAGVSLGSVSNVINNKESVSPEIKAKVKEAIDELDYEVNMQARGFVKKRSYNIGIVLPKENYFWLKLLDLIETIENISKELGFHIILAYSGNNKQSEKEACDSLVMKNIDGLIIVPTIYSNEEYFYKLKGKGIPFVLVGRYFKDLEIPFVKANNIDASQKAVKYLYDKGHRKIYYIKGKAGASSDRERHMGFKKAIEKYNIELAKSITVTNSNSQGGYNAFYKLINSNNLPSAIYTNNDTMALGFIRACYENEVSVPQDISIIGLGHFFSQVMLINNLTTFDPNFDLMGEIAFKKLLKQLEFKRGDKFDESYFAGVNTTNVDMTFIEGETVAPIN